MVRSQGEHETGKRVDEIDTRRLLAFQTRKGGRLAAKLGNVPGELDQRFLTLSGQSAVPLLDTHERAHVKSLRYRVLHVVCGGKGRMHQGTVVALPGVLLDHFPVAVGLQNDLAAKGQIPKTIGSESITQLPKSFGEKLRIRVQIDENEGIPCLHAHLRQAAVFSSQPFVARSRANTAVQTVVPAVVAASKELRASFALRDRTGAMQAHARERSQPAVLPSRDDHGLAGHVTSEVIAGIRHLVGTPDPVPRTLEDAFPLPSQVGGVQVPARRDRHEPVSPQTARIRGRTGNCHFRHAPAAGRRPDLATPACGGHRRRVRTSLPGSH